MKNILIHETLAYTGHGRKNKRFYKNNIIKLEATTWNDNFELPDGSYSISNIQDYFKYIIK